MTKNKKVALISVLSVVLALMLAGGIIVWIVFRPVDTGLREDLGYETVCYELPGDNSTPDGHTGIENIGYMNWVLKHQTYWYSEMHGGVDTVDKQKVTTYKQYYEGVLIATDIATSNLVNSAIQFCAVDDVVLKRYAAGGPSTYNGINTVWKDGKPEGYTIPEYKAAMGFPPTEFSVFVINEKTVLDCTKVTVNADGTYTQTFYLNMDPDPSENDAGYYYKQQMIEKGGLHGDPVFTEAVTITYTFDSDWQVLSSETKEVYKANKGFVANCSGYSHTDYTYGDKELCYNSEYENYYKNYVNDYAPPKAKEITAADCLAEAFAGVMQGETKLAVDATVDGEKYSGTVQLNLDENDIRVALGNIKVYMREEKDGQYLYLSYGDGVKAKIALSDLTSAISSDGSASEDSDGAIVLDKLLAALGDEKNFTLASDKLSATLTPTVDIGELLGLDFSLKFKLNFKFNISAEGAVTLNKLSATTTVLGSKVTLELGFTDKGVDGITDAQAAEYTEVDLSGIISLVSAKALSIDLSYAGGGVNVSGNAIVNLEDTAVKADLEISLDGNPSEPLEISVIYSKGGIYLALNSFDEQPLKVKTDISEAAAIIGGLILTGTGDTSVDFDIEPLLELIGSININGVLNALLKDNGFANLFTLDGADGATLTIDGTALMDWVGVEYDLGDIAVAIKNGGAIGLSALGIEAELEACEPFTFNESEYADAEDIIPLLQTIEEIITNKRVTVSGVISLGVDSTDITLTVYGLSVGWENGIELQLDARLDVNGSLHDFYAKYVQSTGELKVVYGTMNGGTGVSLDISENSEDISTLKGALVSLFNRIAGVANSAVDGKEVLAPVDSFDDLLALIKLGEDATEGVAELAEVLDEIEEEQFSVADILNSIYFNINADACTVEVGGLTLTVFKTDSGVTLSVQTAGVGFEITGMAVVTEATDFNIEVENALTAEDIAELLDYLAATAELAVKDTLNIQLTGEVTSSEEAYAEIEGNVKYYIDATLEYMQGESGYPVHIVPESTTEEGETVAPDFWIAPDMYFHLGMDMISTVDEVDSVLFDIYIFDGNPTIDSNGKTTSAELTSGDNELDIYMSISRVPKAGTTLVHEPVKIYAPMNEIMTVLAAGLALVDVGSISIDALPELNGVITQVGGVLDAMLVDRYFADTKEQFTSLGAGVIESMLGSSISDYINNLINGLTGGDTETPEETEGIMLTAEEGEGYGRIRHGAIDEFKILRNGNDTTLKLVVGETCATVTKTAYTYTVGEGDEAVEHSGTRLTNLHVNQAEINDTDALKDLNIDLAYGGIVKATADDLAGYTSFVGADSLVKALINSATHEVSADGQDEENSANYALNDNFFIDGEISLGLGSWDAVTINIEGLSVTIDDNGDVQVNLSMNYQGFKPLVTLINGDTSVDLSVKNGMVYIKRVQTSDFSGILGTEKDISPIIIYRAMPVEVFLDDIMEQMIFLFNFGDTIANSMRGGGSSSTTEETVKEDYGTQFAKYFTSFTFSEGQWKAVINGEGLSELSGITLGNITATFNAVKDSADNYVVNRLGISGSMFSILSFTADLNWRNPQQDWDSFTAENKQETADGVLAKDPGATVRHALNDMTDAEIIEKLDWDRLAAESGAGYIELIFNDAGEMTSTVQFKNATVKYSVKSGIDDGASEIYISTDTQYVLVNTATNSIYSVLNYPEVTEYAIEGYTLVWLDPVYEGNDTYSVCARYVKTELTVTYYSSVQFSGSASSSRTAGYDGQVYENTVSFLSLSYGRPGTVYSADYSFVGWGYQNTDGTWIAVDDVRNIENLGHIENIALHALWTNTVELSDSGIVKGGSWGVYKVDVYVSFTVTLYGRADLLQIVTLSGGYTITASKSLTSDTSKGTFTSANDNGVFVCSNVGKQISTTITQYSSVSIDVSFTLQINGTQVGKALTASVSKDL